jgi:D-aminopeptidase
MESVRKRARELGIAPGILPTGPLNAITDVHPVGVGHVTVIEDKDIRTGATAIVPHADNVYQNKVPAGIAVGNGYGKLMGSTQIRELGEIETPIVPDQYPVRTPGGRRHRRLGIGGSGK